MMNWLKRRQQKDFVHTVIGLAAAGVGVMLYLAYMHFGSGGDHSICSFGADFSCDLVNQSPYAAPFGMPLSVLGLVFFVAVIAWLLWYRGPQRFMPLVAANVFGLSFGLVLTGIQIFILGSICLFCEASKVLMLLILVVTAYAAGRFKEKFAVSWIVAALLIGLGFGAVVAFGAA
jgi:uncharacterized membrane protein